MIDHLSLGTHRFEVAVEFYRIVLSPCNIELLRQKENEAAFGTTAQWGFFLNRLGDAEPATAAGMHLAFSAVSREIVQQVFEAGLEQGGAPIFSPRERPDISPSYFGAMFRDLDGHKIEVVTNAA